MCNQTIPLVLHKYDFHGRKVKKKTTFGKQKEDKDTKNWKDVIWSDETKMYLLGSD